MAEKERNWGIECMRMLCMLMITVYHVIGHGGILIHPEISQKGYIIGRMMQTLCFCAVDGYALISGYVGASARYRYSTLAVLWTRVWLYSAGLTALAALVAPQVVNVQAVLKSMFPVAINQYWYFTAYVGCFLLAPFARAALCTFSRRQMGVLLATAFAGMSVLPAVAGGDPMTTGMGYSAIWLLLLYALGGYMRKYDLFSCVSTALLVTAFSVCVVITGVVGFACEHAHVMETGQRIGFGRLLRYDSPLMVICAGAMLVYFSRMRVIHGRRTIELFAPLSFSVYLIHDHPIVRKIIINQYLGNIAALRTVLVGPTIVMAAVVIYAVCSMVDILRAKLFERLNLKKRLDNLEKRVLGDLWNR